MTNSSKSRSPSVNSALKKAATALTRINKQKASPYYGQDQQDDIYLNESSVYTQSMRNAAMTQGHSPFRQSALSMSLSRSRSASNNSRSRKSTSPIQAYRRLAA